MKAAILGRRRRAKAKAIGRGRGVAKTRGRPLWELMEPYVGMAELPGDLAANHDHYLYGSPERAER